MTLVNNAIWNIIRVLLLQIAYRESDSFSLSSRSFNNSAAMWEYRGVKLKLAEGRLSAWCLMAIQRCQHHSRFIQLCKIGNNSRRLSYFIFCIRFSKKTRYMYRKFVSSVKSRIAVSQIYCYWGAPRSVQNLSSNTVSQASMQQNACLVNIIAILHWWCFFVSVRAPVINLVTLKLPLLFKLTLLVWTKSSLISKKQNLDYCIFPISYSCVHKFLKTVLQVPAFTLPFASPQNG